MTSKNCRKWSTLSLSLVCVILGIIIAVLWNGIFKGILKHELSVEERGTKGFKMWIETPIPMYLEFYLFNWTNAAEVAKNPLVKPEFVECGPYTFLEKHYRTNITFNDHNGTVTYQTKRVWHFLPHQTRGSLDDKITTINPIAITVSNMFRHQLLVKIALNAFFEEKKIHMFLTKTAREFLFDGYDDWLLDLAHKLNMSGLPFTKFGWFVGRNESSDYDGVFNMYSGKGDFEKLGLIVKWNYNHSVPFYEGECAEVYGTSGELWYPPRNFKVVSLFSPDICSNIKFHLNGTDMLNGVEGHKFIGTEDNFDNGTLYPEMSCFMTYGVQLASGVRNVSACKFGAPAYLSYPHFYLADPSYVDAVIGLSPDPTKHQAYISLEPSTGLPLKVNAVFQMNFLLEPISGIKLYSNAKRTMIPCMWFRQWAELSKPLTDLTKTLLILPSAVTYAGVGLICIGIILLSVFCFVSIKKAWKSTEEESGLLNHQSL